MGLGTKIKSALNGDKTRDGPRRKDTVDSKAPTPPAKTPATTPRQAPGAFPSEAPRAITPKAAEVNAAWNEPKPTHVAHPHSTLRSPSPDYTFRTAESDAGFSDDVSQLSEEFNERTSIGDRGATPVGAQQHSRLSKDPNTKYPYWGAAGTGIANEEHAGTAGTAARSAMGTNDNSPRAGHTPTMGAHGANTAAVGRADGHVKFSTAPQRHVGEQDIYSGVGPTDSTYGELGNYDPPTPRGMGSAAAPPIPDKVPGRAFSGNDGYNATNGYTAGGAGTGLGMTNHVDREPVMDREYGAPANSDSRRQASTSTRGLAAAALARRHPNEDMREYERPPPQHAYSSTHPHAQPNHAQPQGINTSSAYDAHAAGAMASHERGASVTSPTGYQRHSPKDSGFGSGDDYSPAGVSTQLQMKPGGVPGMGDGHFGPGHQGAKVVHRCHACGVDNDISRYFAKEVVYRLGD